MTKGHSIVEYILPLALIVLTLAGISMFTDIPSLLTQNLANTNHGSIIQNHIVIEDFGHVDPKTLPPGLHEKYLKANAITYLKGNTVCFNGSFCVDVPNIPDGMVSEVDGSLGGSTIYKLSALLQSLAEQLQISGAPDDFVQKVRALANNGHEIGDDLYQGAQSQSKGFMNDIELQNFNNMIQQPKYAYSLKLEDLLNYEYAHPEIVAHDPAGFQLLNQAANMIHNIYSNTGNMALDQNCQFAQLCRNLLTSNASLTHMNANTVCTAGNGGQDCQRVEQ